MFYMLANIISWIVIAMLYASSITLSTQCTSSQVSARKTAAAKSTKKSIGSEGNQVKAYCLALSRLVADPAFIGKSPIEKQNAMITAKDRTIGSSELRLKLSEATKGGGKEVKKVLYATVKEKWACPAFDMFFR